MRGFLFLSLVGLIVISPAHATDEGKALYKTLCMSCHVASGRPTVAPPLFGVKNHLIRVYPEREAFVERVVHWVKRPDASKTLMPGAIRRFGLMPALPYPEDQVRKVAEFIYDTSLSMPGWYEEHYRQEHGGSPVK